MKKPSKTEAAYYALERIGSGPMAAEAIAELRKALNAAASLLVSKAADIAGRRGVSELIPDMISAFGRFTTDGARVDKQCNAKISIVNALNALECVDDAVFLTGARYIQMEPVFGGQADTAAELRCGCAYGLARIAHPDAHYVLADLLVDGESSVRAAAAKALAYLGSPEGELLLRLKVLTGDKELDVISECFEGLMTMSPKRSLVFVSRYLKSDDLSAAQCAAIAIGKSHAPGAFDALRKCWDDSPSPSTRRALLLPIALIRSDDAFEFLLEVLRRGDGKIIAQATNALSLYADDESARRVQEAMAARDA